MTLTRRQFHGLAAGALGHVLVQPFASPAWRPARRRAQAPVIERITILRVPGSFHRPVAMNAYDRAPKGKAGSIDLARAILSDGTTGIGVRGYARLDEDAVARLRGMIGVAPEEVYDWDGERIAGVAEEHAAFIADPATAWFESALLDAVGRLRGRPVHALFGDPVRAAADAYDGTLYFADVASGRDASAVGEVAARIRDDGYRAIKMKVGRPLKWVEGEAGVARDVEAVLAARAAVGDDFTLMADANNGYRGHLDWGLRFLEETAGAGLSWMEELLPETRDGYRRLREAMRARGVAVRLAEGEDALWSPSAAVQGVDGFVPWMEEGLFDVIQPDLRTVGFSNVLRQADLAAPFGVDLVPHNWQSELGKLMSVHLALIRENVRFVEDDRWSNYALDSSDHLFRDGRWIAPDTPGWGVRSSEHYERFARSAEERVIS